MVVYDVHGPNRTKLQRFTWIPRSITRYFPGPMYILKLKSVVVDDDDDDDRLLIIYGERFYEEVGEHDTYDLRGYIEVHYKTTAFSVFEFNLNESKWSNVESLGNRAVFFFLGHTNFAMNASDGVARADCIYFTDDAFQIHCYIGSKD